jgi:hypothetical protein
VKRAAAVAALCLWPPLAAADEISSVYTVFDLKNCTQVEKPDEYVYEGLWRCQGYGGHDIWQGGYDARSVAAFGTGKDNVCALRKTFHPFNTALSPVEWRVRNGRPFAAIERWSVSQGDEQPSVTWLVVSKLEDGNSCHMHYVAGSYPNANEQARRAADDLASGFDCQTGTPTYSSKVGAPPIELKSCMELEPE